MASHLFPLLIGYLPFQIALNPFPGTDLASGRLLILVAFLAWLLRALARKHVPIPRDSITALLLAFCGFAFLSLFVAEHVSFALRKLLLLLGTAPLFFLAAAFIKTHGTGAIARAVLVSFSGVALLGIIQFLAQWPVGHEKLAFFWGEHVAPIFSGRDFAVAIRSSQSWFVNLSGATVMRATAHFPDPHHFALGIGMALPFVLGGVLKNKKGYWCAAIVMLAAILFSFSRGAYLALAGSGIFFAACSWSACAKKTRTALLAGAVLAAILLLPWNGFGERLWSSFDVSEGSNQGRLAIWEGAVRLALAHPFTGVGLGNYAYQEDPLAGYRSPISAHNTYFEVWAETGIAGLAVFLAMLAVPVAAAALSALRRAAHSEYMVAAGGGIAFFAIHSFFETTLWNPTNLALLMVLLGIAAHGGKQESEKLSE